MRYYILSLLISMLMSPIAQAAVKAEYNVIPLPRQVTLSGEKPFVVDSSTKIVYTSGNADLKRNADMLAHELKALTGLKLKVTDRTPAKNYISLSATLTATYSEAYRVTVSDRCIDVNGASAAGNFYGIQLLRKAIPGAVKGAVEFPAGVISDYPRFGYRGMHLDVVRHFFPFDSVKTYIDMLALHNINRFHIHLTDDQGWRIEIKKHPRLTEVGSKRKGTMIGLDFSTNDSIPYEGYYTQEQLRELVKYAADRYITVIPEIDLPGHMLGALAAYPELGCTGGPYEVWHRWGISKDVLCAGNDKTYQLIDDVLTEVADIFPSEFIHIGGDECPKDKWKECPKCQTKIQELGLVTDSVSTAEQKLQSHVMEHASDVLRRHGRRAIGWDEILEGGAKAPTAIMSWRGNGKASSTKAAKAGLDVILTPGRYCYFDYMQAEDSGEAQIKWGFNLTVDTVYNFNPVPPGLTEDEAKHILGGQGNVWCELIPDMHYVQFKTLPRMAALCEVLWIEPERKDFDDFYQRLCKFVKHYDAAGYNYAKFIFRDYKR